MKLKYHITFMIDRYHLLQDLVFLNKAHVSAETISTRRISLWQSRQLERRAEKQLISYQSLVHLPCSH